MSEACPPDLALERYHLGEIAGTASAVWIAHIEGCARCQAALAALRRDDEGRAEPLAPRPRASVLPLRALGPLLALAAALVVFLVLRPAADLTPKGGGILALVVEGHDPGQPIPAGARAQLQWSSSETGHLAVIGVERDGRATVLHPGEGNVAVEVGPVRDAPLGGSIVVDLSLDGARICATFRAEPFTVDLDALARRCRAGEATSALEPLRVRP